MGRGAWWTTVHEVTSVRHDLATTQPQAIYRSNERLGTKSVTKVILQCHTKAGVWTITTVSFCLVHQVTICRAYFSKTFF